MPSFLNRNIAFSKVIKAGGRLHEFNFRRRQGPEEPVYEIDASDDYGERHYLTMHQEDGFWTILEPAIPDWMREVSINFPATIVEEELGNDFLHKNVPPILQKFRNLFRSIPQDYNYFTFKNS